MTHRRLSPFNRQHLGQNVGLSLEDSLEDKVLRPNTFSDDAGLTQPQ